MNLVTKPSHAEIASFFRVTPAQVKAQFARTIPGLERDLVKAEATGKPVRGTTAAKFRELIEYARKMSV